MANLNDVLSDSTSLSTPSSSGGIGGSSNREIMADARAALSGNWGMAILGYVLYLILIMSFVGFVYASVFFVAFISIGTGSDPAIAVNGMMFISEMVEFMVSGAFMVGFMGFFLGVAQEAEARLELLFVGFQRFFKSFAVYFFYSLFILLWTLLFIIPGIIACFRYAMAFFIIADDEDCGPLEAIGRSKEMMRGNKWKLFCLYWRFLGWWLLATIFTLGLGYLWLVPYVQTSLAKFYEDVK